jgi:Leucine-rich repeat (LRR) protein
MTRFAPLALVVGLSVANGLCCAEDPQRTFIARQAPQAARKANYSNEIAEIKQLGGKMMVDVVTVNLDFSKVTDAQLAHLKELPELRHLSLAGTQITDAGLTNIKGLCELRSLSIGNTQITEAGLASVGEFGGLQFLDIGSLDPSTSPTLG